MVDILYIYDCVYIYTYGFGTFSFLLDKHEDLSHEYMEIDQKNGVWSSHFMRILKTWVSKSPTENGLRTITQELHNLHQSTQVLSMPHDKISIITRTYVQHQGSHQSTTNITWVYRDSTTHCGWPVSNDLRNPKFYKFGRLVAPSPKEKKPRFMSQMGETNEQFSQTASIQNWPQF